MCARTLLRTFIVLFAAAHATAPSVAAAEPPRGLTVLQDETAGAAPQESGVPSRERINELLESARNLDPETNVDVRDRLIAAYGGTLAELDEAELFREQKRTLEEASERAPRRIAEIDLELANLEQTPPTEPGELDGLELEELERLAVEASQVFEDLSEKVAGLDESLREELEERATIADRKAEVADALAELDARRDDGPPGEVPDDIGLAERGQAIAKRISLLAQSEKLQVEEATFDARLDLLRAEVRLARAQEAGAERTRRRTEAALNAAREAEARKRAAEAQALQDKAELQGEAFAPITSAIVGTREGTVRVAESFTRIADKTREVREREEDLAARYRDTQDRVEIPSLTEAIGLRLREELRDLAEARAISLNPGAREDEQTRAQVQVFRIQGALDELREEDDWISDLVERAVEAGTDPEQALRLAQELRDEYRQALLAAEKALGNKVSEISELQTARRKLAELIDEYEDFVLERVLWIRSSEPLWSVSPGAFENEIVEALDHDEWRALASAYWDDLKRGRTAEIIALLLGLMLLVGARHRIRRAISEEGDLARQRSQVSIAPTFRALLLSLLYGAPLGAGLLALSWVTSTMDVEEAWASRAFAVSEGVWRAGIVALIIGTIRAFTLRNGLSGAHFEWSDEAIRLVRRRSGWLLAVATPSAFLCEFFANVGTRPRSEGLTVPAPFDENTHQFAEGLSRIATLVEIVAIAVFLWAVLHSGRGVLAMNARGASQRDWITHLRRLWLALSMALLAGLAIATVAGYGFTARSLLGRFEVMLGFLIGLFTLRALALRWIRLVRRREAFEKLRKKRDELRAKRLAEIERRRSEGEDVDGIESEGLEVEEDTVDVAALSTDVLQLVRVVTGLAAMFGVYWIWASVLPALGIFDRIHLWSREETVTELVGVGAAQAAETTTTTEWVTLGSLGVAAMILVLTWLAVRDLPSLLEIGLLRRLDLGSGERYAITTLFRYFITIVGLFLAFDEVGLSWSKLQWLVAGVSVGLGFGLQEIFANFVSGITLLFERPVRVGDWVTLGDIEGVVSRIRIRATTIRDRDLKELIVPNREFITGRFINWTLSDPVSRVTIDVGIAYGSDTEKAITLLLESGKKSPYSVAEPAPNVVFKSFGASSLDFELRVFVTGREIMPRVRHDLHMRVDAAFRAAEIEISFPQRDLHIRSAVGLEAIQDERRAGSDPAPSTD